MRVLKYTKLCQGVLSDIQYFHFDENDHSRETGGVVRSGVGISSIALPLNPFSAGNEQNIASVAWRSSQPRRARNCALVFSLSLTD